MIKRYLKQFLTVSGAIVMLSAGNEGFAKPVIIKTNLIVTVEKISGKVTDNNGNAIPGVSVSVKGTTRGTITAADGSFSLDANSGETLVFSFIGYDSQEISAKNNLNVALKESSAALEEVVVTGSRSGGRSNIDSPVPVDVISPKELKGFSQVDVGQILNYVAPSFNSNRQTVTDGTDHVDPASLRGLGPDQVLVLVNGKRRHTSALININGSVGRGSVGTDMNVIPVAAIDHIEVLRDGAAAQYGSDAIAGVINIVMKKNYEGLSASLNLGENVTNMKWNTPNLDGTQKANSLKIQDGKTIVFDISKGFRLGKEGSLTVSGQYNEHGYSNRSGYDNAPTIYLGASGGFPTPPSTVTDVNTFRTQLLKDDATLVAQNKYDRRNMVMGNSSARNMGIFVNGVLPTNAKSQFYFTGGITNRTGTGWGNNRIPVSRAQQPLAADGSIAYPNGFLPAINSTINDQSLIVGYKTMIGVWNMDISNTYGHNRFDFNVSNSGNATLPASNSQQTSFNAGSLIFGQNTTNLDFSRKLPDQDNITNINLALGAELRQDHYQIVAGEKTSYSGALPGEAVVTVPGAPLTIGGAAYGTAVALPGSQVFPGFQAGAPLADSPNGGNEVNKKRNNKAVYADLEGELYNKLLIGMAGRYESYSDFGDNFSGKISARYKVAENFALRGSASTGFRAPSLQQRYFNNTSTQFVSGLPSNTLTVNNDNDIARKTIGVDALRPETSKNFSVGFTGRLNRVHLTVDAYQIEINDRIVYSGAFSRALLGFTATQYVGINNVNFFANAANTRTKGIDIVANTKEKLGKGSLLLTAAINFNNNKVTGINSTDLINSAAKNDPSVTPDNWFKNKLFDRQQISRIEVWNPKSKINLSATYSINKFDFTLRVVRFGQVTYLSNADTEARKADGTYWNSQFARDITGHAYIDQVFRPIYVTDFVVAYKATKHTSITVGANNIFDVYPDQQYIDPRNATGSIDYVSGRDASNRGRALFSANQGGFNGRYIFGKINVNF